VARISFFNLSMYLESGGIERSVNVHARQPPQNRRFNVGHRQSSDGITFAALEAHAWGAPCQHQPFAKAQGVRSKV
jgi:hypothetical protein